MAVVGDQHTLAHGAVDACVHEEEQDPIEVEHLADELLAVLVEQHALQRLLDVHPLTQVLEAARKVLGVLVDRLEEGEEADDDIAMVLPDVLVTRHELGARFDSVLEQLRRLEVPEVKQDVAVRLLLGLILQQEEPRDVIAEP